MQKLAVITEEELFKKRLKRPMRRQKLSNAERIKSYTDLKLVTMSFTSITESGNI